MKHIGVLHESASSVVQATRGHRALDQSIPASPESFSDRTRRTPPAITGAVVMLPVSTFQRGLEELLTGSAFSAIDTLLPDAPRQRAHRLLASKGGTLPGLAVIPGPVGYPL